MLGLASVFNVLMIFNPFTIGNAFQGIRFSQALIIVFIWIGICLGYFLYKLYRAEKLENSIENKTKKDRIGQDDHND